MTTETKKPDGRSPYHITCEELKLFALDALRECQKHMEYGNYDAVRYRLKKLVNVLERSENNPEQLGDKP